MLLVYLAIYVWVIACIFRFGWDGLRETVSELSGFSYRGFSVQRLAWCLTIVNGLLTPLHWWTDWRGDAAVGAAAMLLSLVTIVLCFFTSRGSHGRFMPIAFSVFFFINHGLLTKA